MQCDLASLRPQLGEVHRANNHVWSYDVVATRTHDSRSVLLFALIYEYIRECLAIQVARHQNSIRVIATLSDVMLMRGVPDRISLVMRP